MMTTTDTPHYTHSTIPCEELDDRAHLPTQEQIAGAGVRDPFDMLLIQARKAQIHLEMRLEMLREEEAEAAARR